MKTVFVIWVALAAGSFFQQVDAQEYWQATSGLGGGKVRSLATAAGGIMIAATLDSGVYRSTDGGYSWVMARTGLTDLRTWSVAVDPTPPVVAYAGTRSAGVFRSSDLGATWTQTAFNRHWVMSIATNGAGHLFVATTDTGIHRSTDHGNTWQRVGDPAEIGSDVYSVAVNTLGDIFAGTDARIFRSTDNGTTWVRSDSGVVVTGVIWSLAVNAQGHLYAGDGGGFFTGPGTVYRSRDNGHSWAATAMSNRSALSLALNREGHVFAGTDSGVVLSTDDGDSGTRVNSGLSVLGVFCVVIDSSGYAFAGTAGGGVFRSVQTTVSVPDPRVVATAIHTLRQNYPNPFNPTTKIQFTIVNRQWTIVKVYDILGRDVATLVNEVKEPGTYTVQWDAGGVASGVYFYRLKAGDFVQTRRMMVVR